MDQVVCCTLNVAINSITASNNSARSWYLNAFTVMDQDAIVTCSSGRVSFFHIRPKLTPALRISSCLAPGHSPKRGRLTDRKPRGHLCQHHRLRHPHPYPVLYVVVQVQLPPSAPVWVLVHRLEPDPDQAPYRPILLASYTLCARTLLNGFSTRGLSSLNATRAHWIKTISSTYGPSRLLWMLDLSGRLWASLTSGA